MPRQLTPKQDHFARLIALDGVNQSEAYRRAYDAGNMKPGTVNHNAYALMQNNHVATRVAELRDGLRDQVIVDANKVVKELEKVAFSDLSHLVEWSDDGISIKDSTDLPPEFAPWSWCLRPGHGACALVMVLLHGQGACALMS
jgi:phage terminase small subunit